MQELIITEKPNASKKLAEALADGKPVKEEIKGVPFYKVTHGKKDLLIGCAAGHLFGLAEKKKTKGFAYPVFDIEWIPNHEISKTAAFSKKYLDALKKLAKQADTFTVATDYDVEGEVIGLNIVRYICNRNDARRMKFSTLTKPDLIEAYAKAMPHLDWGQALAGETRHFLDYFYGINLSRALTRAIKDAGMFKILSTGRVQGPALKILADREKEIKAFKPDPFWQLELKGLAKKKTIEAWHKEDKFWDKKAAEKAHAAVKKEKKGTIDTVDTRNFLQKPPTPFDLTSLQTESYRCFGISPKETLALAQDLYTQGYISYPRTSSQQLPPAIGYEKVLKALAKQKDYADLVKGVLKLKPLTPNNGKKTDPAHPAVYPTGIAPKGLKGRQEKVYDLIVKRFMSTFAKAAKRETVTLSLSVNKEPFIAKGTRTTDPQWHEFYQPYIKLEEQEMPAVKEGDALTVKKVTLHEKETQPPKRYTPSSIIKELEKRELGTKATRAEIIDTLSKRHYVVGQSLEVTDLGMHIIEILEKYVPKIVDEKLTTHFELEMQEIRDRKKKKEEVIAEAQNVVTEICADFKKKQKDIGEGLKKTFTETRAALSTVGKCTSCKKGMLVMKRGKFGRFVACDTYPDCKTTFKLPATGLAQVVDETCKECKHPMIKMIRKGKRPQVVCINPECPTKHVEVEGEGKTCPKCSKGKMVLRKSVYGAFLACDQYPKCRTIEKIKTAESKESKS